jgi:Tsp45I type II restriction enzyme
LFEKCSEPKETNTQMGQMFVNWINRKTLGITPVPLKLFGANNENAILEGSDKILGTFAKTNFGYSKNKGLDFVARFNQKYVFAEAKFITSSGGNQDKSFEDVISTLTANYTNATAIGIIDGVVWLKEKTALYKKLTTQYSHLNIMSSLVLREFLYQL